MITLYTRRRDSLFRDPAMVILVGLLLLIVYLVIRIDPVDLQNRAFQSGLDLFYADFLRFKPTNSGANLIAGVLLLQAICAPAFLVLLPQALEIQSSLTDRRYALEQRIIGDVSLNITGAACLAAVYAPILRLGIVSGTMLGFEDGTSCILLSIYQGLLIGLWMGLWYAPRPARLWQRLGVWLMPIVWTIDLMQRTDLAGGWDFDSMRAWLIAGVVICLALIVKLRIWELPAIADDAHA